MKYVLSMRWNPNILDIRMFKEPDEMKEWITRQIELEPTSILGIYTEGLRDDCFNDLKKYESYFKAETLKLNRKIDLDEWRSIDKRLHNGEPMRKILYELGLLKIQET